jgi:NAD(P)-dependent dehydrogenase (short-subunit alcohol dehydrogenase family)
MEMPPKQQRRSTSLAVNAADPSGAPRAPGSASRIGFGTRWNNESWCMLAEHPVKNRRGAVPKAEARSPAILYAGRFNPRAAYDQEALDDLKEGHMQDFRHRVAVITGGASGIGLAVARALGREGAKLVLADIEGRALDSAVGLLKGERVEAIGMVTDVSDKSAVDRLADATWKHFGAAHVVMHNAGVAVFGPVHEMTDEDWKWTVGVNLWGPIHGVEAFLPRMLAQGEEGHMVFTASFAGLVPNRDLAPYNVTKAAVVALAESVHRDLRGTKINASVLCPMRVSTNIDQSARNRPRELGGTTANRTYTEEERSALQGRTLAADQVAELVLDAIRNNRLYIHTHREALPYVKGRAERIMSGFDKAL